MAISRVRLTQRYGLDNKRLLKPAYAESGGTVSTFVADISANPNNIDGDTYRVHKFDTVGTHYITFETGGFIDFLVIASGGSGGGAYRGSGGGGGAGGVLERYFHYIDPGTYTIFVADRVTGNGAKGGNSYFHDQIAFGGGGGGNYPGGNADGGSSGGGSSGSGSTYGVAIVGQGFDGGTYISNSWAAGGGGAGQPGYGGGSTKPGSGGDGLPIAFESNSAIYYAGGGAGGLRGSYISPSPSGGLGGGANLGGSPGGTFNGASANFYGGAGSGAATSSNTSNSTYSGGASYQGLVMLRYRINIA